jgi:hypothetical protein
MFLAALMYFRMWWAWKRGRPVHRRWQPVDRRELGLKWIWTGTRWIETCASCGGDCGRCETSFRIDGSTATRRRRPIRIVI